jgi:hypothetical protein
MARHLKFEKQISEIYHPIILRKCWYNKVKIRETKVSILGSSIILLNGFASSLLSTFVKWNVLHAHDIFVIFALGPFVNTTYFPGFRYLFWGIKWQQSLLRSHKDELSNKPVRMILSTHENLDATDFSWKKKRPKYTKFPVKF